jgi:hypothetical protein
MERLVKLNGLSKLFSFLPTFLPEIYPAYIGKLANFIQSASDPCGKAFKRDLGDMIGTCVAFE